jgi:hypothetical protein
MADYEEPRQKPIARRLRFEILRRDAHTCRYCGGQAPDVQLTVDHVIPRVLGGSDDPTNLVTACKDCNSGKSSVSPDSSIVADVDAAALLFAKAMERAAEIRSAESERLVEATMQWKQAWDRWYVGGDEERTVPLPRTWASSIERFLTQGLTATELEVNIRTAMEGPAMPADTFRYFCGVCWRELTERQELARRLIEEGKV